MPAPGQARRPARKMTRSFAYFAWSESSSTVRSRAETPRSSVGRHVGQIRSENGRAAGVSGVDRRTAGSGRGQHKHRVLAILYGNDIGIIRNPGYGGGDVYYRSIGESRIRSQALRGRRTYRKRDGGGADDQIRDVAERHRLGSCCSGCPG